QMIYELGLLVLREACQMIRRMMDAGHSAVGIAVNVSGLQLLRDEFITDTTDAAETAGIPLSHLEFEITESVLLVNYELINEKLNQIRDMGMTVSVDDFGTGFSSLARLHELNIDSVKVDRYFVQRIRSPHDETLIISDIISLAHKTGLSVVAEGVEDEHQKLFLERHDCDVIQGYWLSRPLPEEDAISFLRRRRA
ncbi:MAG: EAL domain-containing protein, partial [Clostridia bacterium]|nr:EAL domain-containing protein [Clostridia bacterium]